MKQALMGIAVRTAFLLTTTVAGTLVLGVSGAAADPQAATCGLNGTENNYTWTACSTSNDRVEWIAPGFVQKSTCVEFGTTKFIGSVVVDAQNAYIKRVGPCP